MALPQVPGIAEPESFLQAFGGPSHIELMRALQLREINARGARPDFGQREPRVLGKLFGEHIRRMGRDRSGVRREQRRRLRRPSARQALDDRKGQRMEPCAVAGKLELAGGIAEEGVAEEIGGFRRVRP